jgi:hypothetical protein
LQKLQRVKIFLLCNFEVNPITHFGVVALFSTKCLGRGSPFNVSYQNCSKKTYVNDSQNLAFPTSHFVIELLPFDYLSNQKQRVNKKNAF